MKQAEQSGDIEKVVIVSDNCFSGEDLYLDNGFVVEGVVSPDLMYVVKGQRVPKASYGLKRFRDDPLLKHEEGLTVRKLAQLNNIPRIWDAGKTRWVKLVG